MSSDKNEKSQRMDTAYLWDRSASGDPELERLEGLLTEFRYDDRPLVLTALVLDTVEDQSVLRKCLRKMQAMPMVARTAAAAVILFAISATVLVILHPTFPAPDSTAAGWNISHIEGSPQIGSHALHTGNSSATLRVGETLTTGSSSRATLTENEIGEIQVDPNSRLHLLPSGPNGKRVQLDVGTIHAYIWAPPARFVVDTPSAVAVDLGCAYSLQVAPDGSGTIRTTLGWVGFHLNGRDSFIPAGAMCSTRPKIGPGTPYFEDASPAFRSAVSEFDNRPPSDEQVSRPLDNIIKEARTKDSLTLWHLLSRTTGTDRAQVYERLAALTPPPPGATREGILRLDPHMLDLYWNALNLGDISVWRFWQQSELKK